MISKVRVVSESKRMDPQYLQLSSSPKKWPNCVMGVYKFYNREHAWGP